MTRRGALFLDRDGTIITEEHYLNDPDRVHLMPGAATSIARANRAGVPVFIITNQSGIGRGLITQSQYDAVAAKLLELLAEGGARIDATYFCADHPDTGPSSFRKPGMGMYLQAAAEHELDIAKSAYIGDKWRDVQPALTAGGLGILVPKGNTEQSDIDRAMLSARTAADIEQAIGEALVWMRASD